MMEREAFTIKEFCKAHGFSQAHYFNMRLAGDGPRVMQVGKRVLISKEAAADWRREREQAANEIASMPYHDRPGYGEWND